MSSSLKDLYQEIILDHSRNPKNFGLLEEYDRKANGTNPLCGDKVTIFLKLVGNVIGEAKFDARGCAISIASASMMTEMVKGKSIDEAKNFVGKRLDIIITGALQTPTGRMVFGKLINNPESNKSFKSPATQG